MLTNRQVRQLQREVLRQRELPFGIWIAWFYRAFGFLNYERLLDYL